MNHRLILICFILINVFGVVVLNAQNDKYISTGIAANVAVHWAPDSQSFAVQGFDSQTSVDPEWFRVDVETLDRTRFATFPVWQDLTPTERTQLNASPVVHTSPDGQLVLYARLLELNPDQPRSLETHEIVITNRVTGETFLTGINTFEMTEDTRHISTILWNATGNAVVVELIGENSSADIHFIKIPEATDLKMSVVLRFNNILINNNDYATPDSFRNGIADIHPTEDRVLLYANKTETGISSSQEDLLLIDWYPFEESQSRVLRQEFVSDVTFTPRFISGRPSEIVYWKLSLESPHTRGIYLFNLVTNHESLLFDASDLLSYTFSPDGRWAPLVDEADNLYLLDMFPLLNSIPDADTGADQTVNDAADTALIPLDGSASSDADG